MQIYIIYIYIMMIKTRIIVNREQASYDGNGVNRTECLSDCVWAKDEIQKAI